MSIKIKNQMSEIMTAAWSFVRKNGYTMAEALKVAWANFKLRKAMTTKIVRFYFRKIDGSIREAFGSIREAFGTLAENIVPPTQGSDRKRNDSCQVYYDTEKADWRCFKKANLISIA